jgi:hypothetical protein
MNMNHTDAQGGLNQAKSTKSFNAGDRGGFAIGEVVEAGRKTGTPFTNPNCRVTEVLEGIEQSVNELLSAHNAVVAAVGVVLPAHGENNFIDESMVDVRPTPEGMPPLAMRLDMLHTRIARLLQAQIELAQAVRL